MLPRRPDEAQVGPDGRQLGLAAQRARGHLGAPRQVGQRRTRPARRAGRPARARTASTSPGDLHGRQVLGRVDGEVGPAVEHGGLHLLREHALAAQLPDRDVGPPVAVGLDDDELELDVGSTARSSAATCSACQRASGLPRVAARSRRAGDRPLLGGAGDGLVARRVAQLALEGEQLAQRGDQAIAAGRAGGVLERDRRLVQQLAEDPPGEGLDRRELLGVEAVEPAAEALELGPAHLLGRARAARRSSARPRAPTSSRGSARAPRRGSPARRRPRRGAPRRRPRRSAGGRPCRAG